MLSSEKITVKESKKAKQMRLVVCFDGSVKAVKPYNVSTATLERFIQQKTPWILEKLNYFEKQRIQRTFLPKIQKADCLEHKERAFVDIKNRIERLNKDYNFKFNNLRIKNQKTRWGSCSSKNNLNFNARIIFLSSDLADYIVAHELCHLREKNHSADFWQLVSKTIPDYKERRKKLKKIHLI